MAAYSASCRASRVFSRSWAGKRRAPSATLRLQPAFLVSGEEAAIHRFCDQGQRHAQVKGAPGGPFAGALLSAASRILSTRGCPSSSFLPGCGRDLYQNSCLGALVPGAEHLRHLVRLHVKQVPHHQVGLADELHVAILNAVMHHFHISGLRRPPPPSRSRGCPPPGRPRFAGWAWTASQAALSPPGMDGKGR